MITEPLQRTIEQHHTPDTRPKHELDHAAEKWALHSLSTYNGELLRRALNISAALAEFTAELNELR